MANVDPFEGLNTTPTKPNPLRTRTFDFALTIIDLHDQIADRRNCKVIAGQILRSGTSVGSQYREACRARSKAEFISKLMSCLQEADETQYWLELLLHSRRGPENVLRQLHADCNEIMSMMVSSVRTVKGGSGKRNV